MGILRTLFDPNYDQPRPQPRPKRQATSAPRIEPDAPWPLERHFARVGGAPWTLGDACEGTLVLGASGSGKTSGPGRFLATSFLETGLGGIVLCAKADEPELWQRYARETGREADLVQFSQQRLNILEYESSRTGAAGCTENVVQLFGEVCTLAQSRHGSSAADDYWQRAARQLLRHAFSLCQLSTGKISLPQAYEIILSAPQSVGQAQDEDWQASSACWHAIVRATALHPDSHDLNHTRNYWLREWPSLDERPRSSVQSIVSTIADLFMREPLHTLFSTDTTFLPDEILAGKILVVDLPVKTFADVGLYCAVLLKYLTQRAIERRSEIEDAAGIEQNARRPVFVWADEFQLFAGEKDSEFQATARSSRAATVYLSQTYAAIVAAMGGFQGKSKADALLANLGTKIFCSSADPESTKWAAEQIGKKLWRRQSHNESKSTTRRGFWAIERAFSEPSVNEQESSGYSEQMDYILQPAVFTTLARGGPRNDFAVEAILVQAGRIWPETGETWCRVAFPQR